MHVDETYWSIRWSACTGLVPDLSMIPYRSICVCAPQGRSLTATVEDVTSLLLSFSDSVCNECTGSVCESSGGGDEDYDCSPKITQGQTQKQE